MQKFALIGDNISKSLSPALFKAAYPELDSAYELIDCNSAADAFNQFISGGYCGANVTSPYKQQFMDYCAIHDDMSLRCGVTNLIYKDGNLLKCYNTDYYGVRDPLIERGISEGRAVVAGAGGAARAAIIALKDIGMDVTVVNRTFSKAESLANHFNIKCSRLSDFPELIASSNLLVYTIDTPVDNVDGVDFSNIVIFEANYKSPNLNDRMCVEYISGLEWLVSQAVPAFRIFTGIKPDVAAMKSVAENC